MVYSSRTTHLLAVLLLAAASIFSYETARGGLWANAVLGILCCVILLLFVRATYALPPAKAPEPAQVGRQAGDDLRAVLDQSPVPLIRYSDSQGLIAINRAARNLFKTDDIVSGADDLAKAMTEPMYGSRAVLAIQGRQYAVSVSEIVSEDATVRLATLTDVQAEIHKAEAAALRDTLHILSHEIMNSLTPVSSLADIADSYLADEGEPDVQSAREALETLSHRAKTLTRFIEAYRSVARLPEPVFQTLDPAVLLTDIMELFIRGVSREGVAFRLTIEDSLPRLRLDEAQISQAIINVVTNAVEATEGQKSPREVAVSAYLAHQTVVIQISDNGPGVPENVRGGLFSAFVTTKAKGTGTGLNLARQIALSHGGDLRLLDATAEPMTTFVFSFPVEA